MKNAILEERSESDRGVGSRDLFEVLRRATAAGLRSAGAGRRSASGADGRAWLRYRRPCARNCRAVARPCLHRNRFLAGNADASVGRALIDPLGGGGPAELVSTGEAGADLLKRRLAMGRRSRSAVSAPHENAGARWRARGADAAQLR